MSFSPPTLLSVPSTLKSADNAVIRKIGTPFKRDGEKDGELFHLFWDGSRECLALGVAEEQQLKGVWVVDRYTTASNRSTRFLDINMLDIQDISDVEWAMLGVTGFLHWLSVDVSIGGHQEHRSKKGI